MSDEDENFCAVFPFFSSSVFSATKRRSVDLGILSLLLLTVKLTWIRI